MIIDKVHPYWTEKDRQRLDEISEEQINLIADHVGITTSAGGNVLGKWQKLEEESQQIIAEVESRYIKANSKKTLLADAKEIVTAIEKIDFQTYIATYIERIAGLKAEGAKESSLDILKRHAAENYENCYSFLLANVRVQLNAFTGDEENTDKINAFVEKRVSLWYENPNPAYFPMARGKVTDAFAFMNSRNAVIDNITGTATINKIGVQLAIRKLQELHATLGISTDKLLSTAIATFTKQNDFRHTRTTPPKREVTIDLKEYAKLLGYDVDEHETTTPQEAAQEKKRAKNQLDNARKAIRKDLDILHASTLTWEESIKQKSRDYERVSIVTRTGILNGEIKIAFSPELANYFVERNLITQYPIKLLKISGRQPTAYYIGRKLAEHYNIDQNQIRGTNDRISIPALLAVTGLPSYDEVMKQDRHWDRRIKEPLEQALDTLTQEGVLKDWKYTHAKGIDLTEEEAYNITSYRVFAKLYIRFTPADKVDHTERIAAKQQATQKKNASTNGRKKKQR